MPYLKKSEVGSIVLMSSTSAIETFFAPQPCNVLKASLTTYSGQLCQTLGSQGICVNCVSPGPTSFEGGNWDMIENAAPEIFQGVVDGFPKGGWDCASSSSFLLGLTMSQMCLLSNQVNVSRWC